PEFPSCASGNRASSQRNRTRHTRPCCAGTLSGSGGQWAFPPPVPRRRRYESRQSASLNGRYSANRGWRPRRAGCLFPGLFVSSFLQDYGPPIHRVNRYVRVNVPKQARRAIGTRIGDEQLTERVAHQVEQPSDTVVVQFIKNIIQQQYGPEPFVGADQIPVRQPHRDHHCLALTLRPELFHFRGPQQKTKVVAVYAEGRPLQNYIALATALQAFLECHLVQSRKIRYRRCLMLLHEELEIPVEHRDEPTQEGLPSLINIGCRRTHQRVIRFQRNPVGLPARQAQQAIALLEQAVVPHEVFQVNVVDLRYEDVEKPAADLASLPDQVDVVRIGQDYRIPADVVAQPAILRAVHPYRLPGAGLHDDRNGVLPVGHIKVAPDTEMVRPMANIQRIQRLARAPGKGEIVNRIQKIGLSAAVGANENVDTGGKPDFRRRIVPVVDKAQPAENHRVLGELLGECSFGRYFRSSDQN